MILFRSTDDERIAIVTDTQGRAYTLAVYASEDAYRDGADPVQSHALRGSPSVAQITATLPGFANRSTEIVPGDPTVPPAITAWQIRRWLITHGITLASVDAAIASIPDESQRMAAQVDWEWAPYVERSHPMLPGLAAALGIEDVDKAFIEAERLG